MYLSEIEIKSFRSFEHTTVSFDPSLTALVGENNSGKSNVIDALRLITKPVGDRRDRYCEDEDVRDGSANKAFSLKATYKDLSMEQQGMLISALSDPSKDVAIFGLDYKASNKEKPRGEVKQWAGKHGLEPEQGASDFIRHVYLPPLRDAQRALASGNSTRILSLLRHFLDETVTEEILIGRLKRNADHETIVNINGTVDRLLKQLTHGVRAQTTSLGFAEDENLADIARDLRFKLSDEGISPEDLCKSGLGFANLLFMAIILVELEKAQDADLTLFLVEEPEAHLHPQLQSIVLSFLLEQAEESQKRIQRPGQPAGRIQVIVTTHSPNMAAGVSPKHLTIMRSIQVNGERRQKSVAIPIDQISIPKPEMDKVARYIDVTKSSILFGKKCLLVEGIVEALLLPVIAKHYLFKDESPKIKLNKFLGTALIPIHGVDFDPYIHILLSNYNGYSISDLVVVITDEDPHVPGNRKDKLEKLAEKLESSNKLKVFTNEITLEHELFCSGNKEILKKVYLQLHPRSANKWQEKIEAEGLSSQDQAKFFLELFENPRTLKGDFGQLLIAEIEENPSDFTPPQYLKNAIQAVVE
jgi:putative ATP-dependent endonuclease of OLD family